MSKSILGFISSIGKQRIDGPTFIKEFEDSGKMIQELVVIADAVKDKAIQDEIEMDIRLIKAGDQGEKNVYYELKNSFIPMLILHNVVIQYDDYKAQMDFVLITNKFICILETKKLNGNITINSDGDFIRSYTNQQGKVYKKEGMYSPISQNQRHVRILANLLLQEKVIKKTPVLSLVVIANPKSIIDFKYAKKEIKEQIVKYDQLTARLKKMLEGKSEVELLPANMMKMADFLVANHVELENTFIQKYKAQIKQECQSLENNQQEAFNAHSMKEPSVLKTKETSVPEVEGETGTIKGVFPEMAMEITEMAATSETRTAPDVSEKTFIHIEAIREALTKFRLEKSRAENVKPYYIYNNKQMEDILEKMPTTLEELMNCDGFGPVKIGKYGQSILNIIGGTRYR